MSSRPRLIKLRRHGQRVISGLGDWIKKSSCMWKAQRNLGCWYRCYFDTSHPLKHWSSNCKTLPTRSEHITQDTHNPQIPIQSSICSMHQNEPNQQPCPQRDSTASASVPDPQETPKGPCPDVSEPFWQHLRGFFFYKSSCVKRR